MAAKTAGDGRSGGLDVDWLHGPTRDDHLDVGLVSVSEGTATPTHVHLKGQVIVVIEGRGFVRTRDEEVEVGPGDVVIADPGELHTHGAVDGSDWVHLTVTTGDYEFPES